MRAAPDKMRLLKKYSAMRGMQVAPIQQTLFLPVFCEI